MKDTDSLLEIVQDKLNKGDVELPVLNPKCMELREMLASESFDTDDVAAVIQEDQALTSQLLRVANSAFFSGLRKVRTVKEAITRLGTKKVSFLVLLVTQEQNYHSKHPVVAVHMKTLWKHAICTASASEWIAQKAGFEALESEAYLAGLLHDIGELFLLKVLEELDASGRVQLGASDALVLETLEAMHAEQGHHLLTGWNLPETYCNVALEHHQREYDPGKHVLVIVRLADAACDKLGISMHADPTVVLPALPEAQTLGLGELQLAELEIAIEDASERDALAAAS